VTRSPFPWNFFEKDLKFSAQQRDALVQLGLFPEQIELLEQLLPECAFAVRKQPPRTELDSKLQAIERPLMRAREAFATLRRQQSAAAGEALLRIRLVDPAPLDDGARSGDDALERAIDRALTVLSIAQNPKRAGQQRHKRAALFPTGKIAAVLQEGFRRHYESNGSAPPRYTLRVSRSGEFREIVSICYEAIGEPDTDPDRAIRAYLERERVGTDQLFTRRSHTKQAAVGRQPPAR
jgi:hypothetical protein